MPVDDHRAPVDLQQTLGGSSARTVPSRASFAAVPAARSAGSASAARRGRSAPPAAGGAAGGALSPERPLRGGGSSLTGPASCLAPAQRPWSPRCRAPSGGAPGETGPPVPPGHFPAASRPGCSAPPARCRWRRFSFEHNPVSPTPTTRPGFHSRWSWATCRWGALEPSPRRDAVVRRYTGEAHTTLPLARSVRDHVPGSYAIRSGIRPPPFPTSTGPQRSPLEGPQMRKSGVLAHLLPEYDLFYGRPDPVRAFPRHRS